MTRELLETMDIDEATDYVNGLIAEIDSLRKQNSVIRERHELLWNVHCKFIGAYHDVLETNERLRRLVDRYRKTNNDLMDLNKE